MRRRLVLTEEERRELEHVKRHHPESSLKALIVLESTQEKTFVSVAKKLHVHRQTVSKVVRKYLESGIKSFARIIPPGRPKILGKLLEGILPEMLAKTPGDYGYPDGTWTLNLIRHNASKNYNIQAGNSTVSDTLHNLKYSYKRTCHRPPLKALPPEEKKKFMESQKERIKELFSCDHRQCEILFVDESSFSNQPYITKSWSKKGEPNVVNSPGKRQKTSLIGALSLLNHLFYFRQVDAGNGENFIKFMRQIKQNKPNSKIFMILDNGRLHHGKRVKHFAKKYGIVLIFLPPYSPEYNHIERFWGWLKKKVYECYNFASIEEMMRRVRRLVVLYNRGQMLGSISMTNGFYKDLVNFIEAQTA